MINETNRDVNGIVCTAERMEKRQAIFTCRQRAREGGKQGIFLKNDYRVGFGN